jgi:hypothetical protein
LGVAVFQLTVTLIANKKLHPLILLVVYALSIFIIAFLVFYSTTNPRTYARGLNVAFVFSLYLLCMLDWPKLHPALFGLMFMQFFPFATTIRAEVGYRYIPKAKWFGGGYALFEKYSRVFSAKLVPCDSKDPWDNTVAFYGLTYNFNCAISPGLSWNYILNSHPVTRPRYIMTDKRKDWSFAGYEKTYSDDLLNIFEKKRQCLPTAKETGSEK